MGKKKSTTKRVPSKASRTAKHGGARPQRRARSVSSASTSTTRTLVPANRRPPVSPPNVSIDLKKVFVVGDVLPLKFDWASWNLCQHLESTISGVLAKSPTPCWVYLSTELLDSNTLVPIAVIIQSVCVPARLFAARALQSETEELLTFDDVNARWAPTPNPSVYILESNHHFSGLLPHHLLLHCESPAAVAAEKPLRVESVSIKFEGKDVVWVRDDGSMEEAVDEFIEDELSDATDDDKDTMIRLLREELERATDLSRAASNHKKRLYMEMMAQDEAMSVEGIEGKKVFKVYPQDSRLDPVVVSFGDDIQIAKGFVKKAFVNRYIGNCDEVF